MERKGKSRSKDVRFQKANCGTWVKIVVCQCRASSLRCRISEIFLARTPSIGPLLTGVLEFVAQHEMNGGAYGNGLAAWIGDVRAHALRDFFKPPTRLLL